MNTVIALFGDLWNALRCVGELLGYLLRFVSVFFRSRTSLAARLLAAESQLGMCKRRIEQKQPPKPRFSRGFRVLWVILSKLWVPWQAATVKAWHTRAFKLYWRWKSRRKAGRPPISQEMQDLIRKLSRENPLSGAGQIRDNLLPLHYDPPQRRSDAGDYPCSRRSGLSRTVRSVSVPGRGGAKKKLAM